MGYGDIERLDLFGVQPHEVFLEAPESWPAGSTVSRENENGEFYPGTYWVYRRA